MGNNMMLTTSPIIISMNSRWPLALSSHGLFDFDLILAGLICVFYMLFFHLSNLPFLLYFQSNWYVNIIYCDL